MNQCRICGMNSQSHQGTVDCINALREHVVYLNSLLPNGEQVLRASLTREASVRLWIEGPITHEALSRLIRFVEFMREAWTDAEQNP